MLKHFFQPRPTLPPDPAPGLAGLLAGRYAQQVVQKQLRQDPAQLQTLQVLQTLLEELAAQGGGKQRPCRSVYIYGDVGRGKSMLMALFYEACPITQKRRVHFNTFMQEVHTFIYKWRQQNQTDAISALAQNIRSSVRLLCFDEFHVTDIADAMILGRLFGKLFELGLVVVITSNRHPNDLYQGGLQREQFLFFIGILEKAAHIIELSAEQDYRLGHGNAQQVTYYCPLSEVPGERTEQMRQFVWQTYRELSEGALLQPDFVVVLGREIQLKATYQDILFTSFDELCAQALSAADYLAMAGRFNIVMMVGIPQLSAEKRNEAKRFMTLIDVLYEHTIKLICSAQVPAPELYTEGDGAFEFKRTVSRLIEMQSDSYCQRADALRQNR
jgi:cell division protein ZapE